MSPKKKQKTTAAPKAAAAAPVETKEKEEETKMEVKEEVIIDADNTEEGDAPPDSRKKSQHPVRFHVQDVTPNVVPSSVGNMLLTIKDGGLQYLSAGARASVGMKSGRYAFEVKIVETLNPAEAGKPQSPAPKSLLRVGFSTAGGNLILGDGDDNICFDETGFFMHNKGRAPRAVKTPIIFNPDSSIVLVLNLNSQSKFFNTVSLLVDGERVHEPQPLPESLKGKVLYPTVTFKNVTLHTNFLSEPQCPPPFVCRMLEDAAADDVVVSVDKSDDVEVVFPIFLPDKGTFDWCDWFLKENPSRYTELSDRAISAWATNSGLRNAKALSKKGSNDKPDMGFGIPSLDDGGVKDTLRSLAPVQGRSYLVMELKNNLVKEDRKKAISNWKGMPGKKVAQVMLGTPEEGFKKSVHALILAEKQAKLDKEFEAQKAERTKKKQAADKAGSIARAMQKAQALKRLMEETAKRKLDAVDVDAVDEAEAGEAEADEAKVEEKAEDETKEEEKPEEGEVKAEEGEGSGDEKMEVQDEEEEKPPQATLTMSEKQIVFRKPVLGDLAQPTLNANFSKFSIPDESEGFDEIRFTWSSAEDSAEALRRWLMERKLTTRIEDLQPSAWFQQKWKDWQKDLQSWHVKHMEYKDPSKKTDGGPFAKASGPALGASCKAAPAQKPEAKKDSDGDEAMAEAGKSPEKEKEVEENADPMQALEDELDREDIDIFGVENVNNHDKDGTPLFSNFAFEDWALLSLRFELHLLAHAFRHDADDPERTGIHPDHLAFYYNRYYKKGLNPKNYGVDTVEDLVELVKDTAMADARTKLVESMVADELESNDIFVKLTEESRRDRQHRVDSGEEDAKLKFSRPTGGPGAVGMAAAAPPTGPRPLAQGVQTGVRPVGNLGIRPKAVFPAQGGHQNMNMPIQPKWGGGGAFNPMIRPSWGNVRPSGMAAIQQRANMLQGQWNKNFGNMWGQNWRG